MRQSGFKFPRSFTEKYRPVTIDDFIGLERVKAVMKSFVAEPYPEAFGFFGDSGTGKTVMGQALARVLPAELHEVASADCDLAKVEHITRMCWYIPNVPGKKAKFHVLLVNEADTMSPTAQNAFLSRMDSTAWPPNTIFIFTANSTTYLHDRLLSRMKRLKFSSDHLQEALPKFLAKIAKTEGITGVDFRRLAVNGNVRDSLNRLQTEKLAGAVPEKYRKLTWELAVSDHLWDCSICDFEIEIGQEFYVAPGEIASHKDCLPPNATIKESE
jgi:DNA polymerase III delta prime subunit